MMFDLGGSPHRSVNTVRVKFNGESFHCTKQNVCSHTDGGRTISLDVTIPPRAGLSHPQN